MAKPIAKKSAAKKTAAKKAAPASKAAPVKKAIAKKTASPSKAAPVKKSGGIINISESAANRIKKIAKEEKKSSWGLRFIVLPSGCCGMQYGMDFEEKASKTDLTVEQHGLKIFIDKSVAGYVEGAKIDFSDEKFKITNPQTSCGDSCGSSCKGNCSE